MFGILFISYSVVRQDIVTQLSQQLRLHGAFSKINVDLERTEDCLSMNFEKSVDEADLLLIMLCGDYMASKVCLREAHYITKSTKPIFLIRMAPLFYFNGPFKNASTVVGCVDFNVLPNFAIGEATQRLIEAISQSRRSSIHSFIKKSSIITKDNSLSPQSKLICVNVPTFLSSTYYSISRREKQLIDTIDSFLSIIEQIRKDSNLIVFGAKGCGKTTLLAHIFNSNLISPNSKNITLLWIDLVSTKNAIRLADILESVVPAIESSTGELVILFDHIEDEQQIDVFQKRWPSASFILVTETEYLSQCCRSDKSTSLYVSDITEKEAVDVLKTTFKLRSCLNQQHLSCLAHIAGSSPLALNIIGSKFSRCSQNSSLATLIAFEEIVSHLFNIPPESIVSAIVKYKMSDEDVIYKKFLQCFLLFEPGEHVSADDLAILWQCKSTHQALVKCYHLVNISLARCQAPFQSESGEKFFIHPLVYNALVLNNVDGSKKASLRLLRWKIITGNLTGILKNSTTTHNYVVKEAIKQRRWLLFGTIASKLDPVKLKEICKGIVVDNHVRAVLSGMNSQADSENVPPQALSFISEFVQPLL